MVKKIIVNDVILDKTMIPIIKEDDIFKVALERMNSFGLGITCIVTPNNKLIGILTDGDIRRRLLKSQKPLSALFIDDAVKHSIKSPITIVNTENLDDAIKLMEEKKIWDIPVVDKNQFLLGLLHLHRAVKQLLKMDLN